MALYHRIGEEKITEVIADFYQRAFTDSIIGHFFFNKDINHITKQQTAFAVSMLGGPKRYQGRPLELVHSEFAIRKAHFDRRQTLMRETMEAHRLNKVDCEEWLVLEDNLRRLIITVVGACNDNKAHNSPSQL